MKTGVLAGEAQQAVAVTVVVDVAVAVAANDRSPHSNAPSREDWGVKALNRLRSEMGPCSRTCAEACL